MEIQHDFPFKTYTINHTDLLFNFFPQFFRIWSIFLDLKIYGINVFIPSVKMIVYLTSAYPFHPVDNFAVIWLQESSRMDPFLVHSLTDDPEKADVILFTEHHPPRDPYFFKVLTHPLYKQFPDKVLLYSDIDKPLPLVPGIFPSIERKYYNPRMTKSGPYIARHCENESIVYRDDNSLEKTFLFSFLGASRTHKVRSKILQLDVKDSFFKDTSDKNLWELDPHSKREFEREYIDVILRSHFILCPRGEGVNSYRLYETMEMGRTPVIISDDWVPMTGPDWDSFSIRIAEKDIDKIPEILSSRKSLSKPMGEQARKNWEVWFSKEICFHRIASLCCELKVTSKNNIKRALYSYGQFLRPFHARKLLSICKNRIL